MMGEVLGSIFSTADGSAGCVAEYANLMASGHPSSARQHLLGALAGRSEHAWLECARALVLRADIPMATALLAAAMAEHPNSGEVRFALAGMYQQANQTTAAEALLRELLLQQPDHVAATFLLVHILKDAGRMQAAADAARALFRQGRHALADVIQAVELLDECDRKQDAAAICEGEIAAGATDPRLHAYAGMLSTQLGQFELARQRYLFAFGAADQAAEWNIPLGLAGLQRYVDRQHPDLVLFQNSLQRPDLSDRARGSLLFALAKAHDDLGDYAQAAHSLRQANALLHASLRWSRKLWRRGIDARIARRVAWPMLALPSDWTPVFIVGMPRSGTTLLAELLSRHPDVCNRGELAWMPQLEQQLAPADEGNRGWLESAAATYQAQLRQDDSDARWFIDKQPHNFLCVDLILALFPNARIIYCQRNARDNALSLWSQCFVADAQRFSYDFSDIAAVSQGCRRVMAHWQTRHPGAIQTVRYEQLTADPTACIAALATWLGLPACDLLGAKSKPTAISTASLWQARQPVYTRSVERWRHYAPYLPELLQFPDN